MSGSSGVSNVERRTWDIDHFESIAKSRTEEGNDDETVAFKKDIPVLPRGFKGTREEFCAADVGAVGPEGSARAYLRMREKKVALEAKLGKTQIITTATAPDKQGGWWCEVCKCLLKDSMNYLDHINGRKHQRALGFTMRVERSSVHQVKDRFKMHRQKRELERLGGHQTSAVEDYERRLESQLEDEERRKRQKKDNKDSKRRELEALEAENMDPEIAQMMGFGGFGTSGAKS